MRERARVDREGAAGGYVREGVGGQVSRRVARRWGRWAMVRRAGASAGRWVGDPGCGQLWLAG